MIQLIKKNVEKLFKGGFFHIFLGNTFVKMISFISSIVIVRLVSKQDYAYLSYADNLYNYVIAFAGLGMNSAVLKYCAVAKSREEDCAYFRFAMKYGTLAEMFLSLVVVGYATFFTLPFPDAKSIILVLVLYPVFNNVVNTIMSYLRAHGENQKYAKMALLQTSMVFLFSVIFTIIMGIMGIPVARYVAMTVAVLYTAKYLYEVNSGVKPKYLTKTEVKGFTEMSVSLMISSLFSLIMPFNEMTLVSELLRDEVITANYKIAILIPGQLAFVAQSIVIYYFTIIAKEEDGKKVWKLSKKIGIFTAFLILVITIAGMVCTPWIIRLVYGSQYEDAISLSVFFWVVYALNSAIRMVPMNFLPAIGVTKFNAWMAAGSCAVHLVITYFAISSVGIWGAGIATGLVYLGSGLIYWIYYRKKCIEI